MNDALLEADVLARGQQVRREVLGPSHVQASYDVDALSRPKTQMAEYVWSKIWARPGLPVNLPARAGTRRSLLPPGEGLGMREETPSSRPQFATRAPWRLSRKCRSIANLAMLTALNRPHELKLHVKAAINNGLTPDEIGEVLLQTAVYCGVAAAEDSFRIAREAFAEMAATQGLS